MNKNIFKAYDIRGIYPEDINPETVIAIGCAVARMFNPGSVVLAHDIRHGSPELAAALGESILSEAKALGKDLKVINAGLSTTPMFYFLVNHFKSSGGCMITASHNPKNYNGVKTVREGAEMVSGTEVLKLVEQL